MSGQHRLFREGNRGLPLLASEWNFGLIAMVLLPRRNCSRECCSATNVEFEGRETKAQTQRCHPRVTGLST
jgi:hypothetical protein